MDMCTFESNESIVALYTSAWIEMAGSSTVNLPNLLSHSTRVRGLKSCVTADISVDSLSHSTRVRGLKFRLRLLLQLLRPVALYTSAWIEILVNHLERTQLTVALYTSAWIEI